MATDPNLTSLYKGNLVIAHINVRSLVPSLLNIKTLLVTEEIDVLAITETWLNDSISNASLDIPGYVFLRQDRGSRGGGIGAYVRSSLHYQRISTLGDSFPTYQTATLPTPRPIEAFSFILYHGKTKIAMNVIYRPPSSPINCLQLLENFLLETCDGCNHIICLGDLNIDLLASNQTGQKEILKLFSTFNLTQIIQEPTRITEKSQTLIDIISLDSELEYIEAGCHDYQMSDHLLTYCVLKMQKIKPDSRFQTYRNFRNLPIELLNRDTANFPWVNIMSASGLDAKVEYFTQAITSIIDGYAPLQIRRISRPPAPWLSDRSRILIKEKNKARLKWRRTKTNADRASFKLMCKEVQKQIKLDKEAYFGAINNNVRNTSEFWRKLREMGVTKSKKTNIQSAFSDSDLLNNHFLDSLPSCSPDNELIAKLSNSQCSDISDQKFTFSEINGHNIYNVLVRLKTSAPGIDGLSGTMLILCLPNCLPALLDIINTSLSSGIFPSHWKTSLVHPIPKKTIPESLSDFRPISILCLLSKIIEKIVHFQLVSYFNRIKAISSFQSGFRKKHSTTTALLRVTDSISRAMDASQCTILIFLDFSRAFDTISHELLLARLKFLGLGESALRWVHSYVSNRWQCTIIDTTNGRQISEPRKILSGVPQGSILGPLFYSVYSSSLLEVPVHCKIHAFADDSQMWLSFPPEMIATASDKIAHDLRLLSEWAKKNSLCLNVLKTFALKIGSDKIVKSTVSPNFTLNGQQISYKSSIRNLGIIFDENLRFDQHVTYLVRSAYTKLKLLYPYRGHLSDEAKLALSQSLIMSNLLYAGIVYVPFLNKQNLRRLQNIQNSCLRFSYGIRKFDHITPAFQKANWLQMNKIWIPTLCTLVHRTLQSSYPVYLRALLTTFADNPFHRERLTRIGNTLYCPMYTSSKFESSFSYTAYKYYNSLPSNLRDLSISPYVHKKGVENFIRSIVS